MHVIPGPAAHMGCRGASWSNMSTRSCSESYRARPDCRGQALVESCLAMAMISLLFFGLFQVARIFAAREMLQHAAARAARARAVGFNDWMVRKSMRVAAIPNAGAMLEPVIDHQDVLLQDHLDSDSPGNLWEWVLKAAPSSSDKAEKERARVPEYMGSLNKAMGESILDYEEWDTLELDESGGGLHANTIQIDVVQRFPLLVAMHKAFYNAGADSDGIDRIRLRGSKEIDLHYEYYLDDMGW